jgi:hypothetical protein
MSGYTTWTVEGSERAQGPHTFAASGMMALKRPLHERNESDPVRCAAELVQRGQLILDVAAADLQAAQTTFGPFHPTTWHFRNALDEARRSWEQLRVELGSAFLASALRQLPLVVMDLREPTDSRLRVELVLIGGQTYQTQEVSGTALAPVQWRLTRLNPPLDHGPYYVCRLADGSTQCDCANWTYRIAETEHAQTAYCKHMAALAALGRI